MSFKKKKALEPTFNRVPLIDTLRGLAIVLMIIFHFKFDLSNFGIEHENFYKDPFWLVFRMIIMTLFVTIVGISLTLANASWSNKGFWRRNSKVLFCALLVTIGSYVMFPQSYIYFGILHFILLASLLGSFLVAQKFAWFLAPVGAVLVLLTALSDGFAFFDQSWLNWFGLMTHKPFTEDYVPLLPWIGLVFIGISIGNLLIPRLPINFKNAELKPLTWLGQRSLLIYMIHQPILIGLVTLWLKFR